MSTPLSEIKAISRPSGASFIVQRLEESTEFSFDISAFFKPTRGTQQAAGVTFALDDVFFQSAGSHIQLIVTDKKMRKIFSEVLGRKVFALPVFQTNVAPPSAYIEPMAAMVQGFLGKIDDARAAPLLRNAMLENLIRHIACVWPNTHLPELVLPSGDRPPLALRIALDYIYWKGGVVKSVEEIASQTNVGVRALEKIFKNKLNLSVKKYCKIIFLKQILEKSEEKRSKKYKSYENLMISNTTRMRREIVEYKSYISSELYPWEIYRKFNRASDLGPGEYIDGILQ